MEFFIAAAMMIFGSGIAFIIRKIVQEVNNSSLPEEQLEAVVVAKRMHMTGGEHAATFYYATFEFTDDRRMELVMNGSQYGALAEGDRGVLVKKGTRFVSFRRTEDRFDARGAAQREHKCSACGAPYTGRVCPYCGTPFGRE
ncbi:MAG: DUF2500 family protein [Clostridiales bacterium]|nr:DUF2500 family protein [Clostridiales bacterium]